MQLKDLRKSILKMGREDAMSIHREIRKNRIDFSKNTKETRKKNKSRSVFDVPSMAKIKQDKKKLKELLALLEEE